MSGAAAQIIAAHKRICENIKSQMFSRGVRVSNELRNSVFHIMQGQGGGRIYGTHQASAPGAVPAVRTGSYRGSLQPSTAAMGDMVRSRVETNLTVSNGAKLGDYLENGTPGGQMAPRPHLKKIAEDAKPKAIHIYSEPYGT